MPIIYEAKNFVVEAVDQPHVTRTDGGHLVIRPKTRIRDRTELSPALAIELMRLSMVVGEAFATAMKVRGVDIGRINYQDNGNWGVFKPEGPFFHLHLYGRAKSAKIQKYGDALHMPQPSTGFYKDCEPLNASDIQAIRDKIEKIFHRPIYTDVVWKLRD